MKGTVFAAMAAIALAGSAMADEIYFSDLEDNDGGWVASANWDPGDWQWGMPTNVGPNAFSGVNVWATVLDGNHSNSGGNSFLTQVFDFSGYVNVQLSFQNWINSGSNSFDQAKVFVNGNEEFFSDGGPTGDWEEVVLDLSAYDGMSDVEIVFDFFATTVVEREGWYLDDIGLNGDLDVECLTLDVDNLVGGETATYTVGGGTPGQRGVVVWGTGGEPTRINDVAGWCATFGFDIQLQGRTFKIVGSTLFDDTGTMVVKKAVPARQSGRTILFQAAERNTCPGECVSDVDELVIG